MEKILSSSASEFAYDPYSLEAMRQPHRFYGTLRDRFPAYFMPQYDAWAISRFEDVLEGFLDAQHFSEFEGQIISRENMRVHHHGTCPELPIEPFPAFVMLDPPIHTRLRQLLAPPLMKGAVNRMADFITETASKRLDLLMEKGEFDLNAEYASFVSGSAIALLCGVPSSRVPELIALVNRSMAREPGQPGFTEAGLAALGELGGMLVEIIANRRKGCDDKVGLIDAFFTRTINDRFLTDQEIAQNLISIVVGGAETVPKITAGGLYELAQRPDQRAAVAADPDNNAPIAVEEMLRFNAPAQWFARTVKHERRFAGVDLKVGQRLMLLVASANRDPREFDNPDEFIWNRRAKRLISFGMGPHFCIGIHLARLEIQIMVRELLKRMPRYAINEQAGEWSVSEFQIGWTQLPIRVMP